MMSPDEKESSAILNLKQLLKRPTFHMHTRPDEIIVYQFDNLSREVLIQWVDFLRSIEDKLRPSQRILYDFRGAGPPSRFMIDRLPTIMAEMKIPQDTLSAFLVSDDLNGRFTRNALDRLPANIGKTKSFLNLAPALRWLADGIESEDKPE